MRGPRGPVTSAGRPPTQASLATEGTSGLAQQTRLCGGVTGADAGEGGGAGMHWKGGRYLPDLQGAQPTPSHSLSDGICNRQ